MSFQPTHLQSIFFDLDNTLINHSAAEKTAFRQSYEHFQLSRGRFDVDALLSRYHIVNEELWSAYRQGRVTTADVRIQRWQRIMDEQFADIHNPDDLSADALSAFYLSWYDQSSELMDGAAELLELCQRRFRFVGLITNGFPDQVRRKLTNHDWHNTFHAVIISEVVGIAKPHADIFSNAASQLDHDVSHTAYVGDNYEIDIVGAKSSSWNTIWLRLAGHDREDTSHADLIIDSLQELTRLLE